MSPLHNAISRLVGNRRELTILLLGEVGTGKTTFLSLLANVLTGNLSGQYTGLHDPRNEANGSPATSRTKSAKVYEFKAGNNLTLRIVDTPGLADNRGLEQDERHKGDIAAAIRDHIRAIDAAFILVNGSAPCLNVADVYALSTLATMIPNTISRNTSIIFTHVANPSSWTLDNTPIPGDIRNAKQFLIDNPIALQMKNPSAATSQGGETNASKVLVEVFDWLNTLSSQPINGLPDLYQKSKAIEKNLVDVIELMRHAEDGRKEEAWFAREVEAARKVR